MTLSLPDFIGLVRLPSGSRTVVATEINERIADKGHNHHEPSKSGTNHSLLEEPQKSMSAEGVTET